MAQDTIWVEDTSWVNNLLYAGARILSDDRPPVINITAQTSQPTAEPTAMQTAEPTAMPAAMPALIPAVLGKVFPDVICTQIEQYNAWLKMRGK